MLSTTVSQRASPGIESHQGDHWWESCNSHLSAYTLWSVFQKFSKYALLFQSFLIFSPLHSFSNKSALPSWIIHKINTRDKQEATNPTGSGKPQGMFVRTRGPQWTSLNPWNLKHHDPWPWLCTREIRSVPHLHSAQWSLTFLFVKSCGLTPMLLTMTEHF